MNRTAQTLMIAALVLFAAGPVFAGQGHGHGHSRNHDHEYHAYRVAHIHKRLKRQHTRIENGIDDGSLTNKEEHKLLKQQRRIRRLAREFHHDGYLSHKEQRVLIHKLDKASDRIWRLKHNDAQRYCRLDGNERLSLQQRQLKLFDHPQSPISLN